MTEWAGNSHRRVVFGDGLLATLPQEVRRLGFSRVLLATGRASFQASGAEAVVPLLTATAMVRRWSDFTTNTDAADLVRGLDLARSYDPDCIVGVGGGSVLDMAKLLAAYLNAESPDEVMTSITDHSPVPPRRVGLILVPTTSGSGSEATHFAVVYIGDSKFSVAHEALRPDVAILDPALTVSAPRHQRASSGMDALSHSIESLWAVGATTASRRYAARALRCLMGNIRQFVEAPTSTTARAMVIGSHLAGRAIDLSKTTAPHALSYAITKRFGVSHGHAVALTLGAFLELHADAGARQLEPSVDEGDFNIAIETVLRSLEADSGASGHARVRELMDHLGLATRLSEISTVPTTAAIDLAHAVNTERLSNNPVPLSTDQLRQIVDSVI